jgi:outer membrane protein assembly factor BamB
VVAHAPDDGRVLWEYPWPGQTERAFQPVVLPDDRVFVSTGYGVGAKLLHVQRDAENNLVVELLWESRGLKAKFTNVVYSGGFLYGLDDGILVCLDPETGERRWKRGRYGHGQIMLVDDLLLVLGEDGTVALVEASPEAYREVSRFPALEGKTWNHPALAGPYLLVRNDHEAACYELPLAQPVDEDA